MAVIRTVAESSDALTVDTTSLAARGSIYDSAGNNRSNQVLTTYAAVANIAFTPASAASNDLITISGSATKTVKVYSLYVSSAVTTAASTTWLLTKRSTAPTGGVSLAANSAIPLDANDAVATANVRHWTSSPGTPGTLVGNINTVRVAISVPAPTSLATIERKAGVELIPRGGDGLLRPITLRGVAESLTANWGGLALITGQVHQYSIMWTEE